MPGRQKQSPAPTELARWLVAARDAYFDPVKNKRGISQRGLAENAGVSQARVVQVESGDDTTRDFIERVASALDIDPTPGFIAAGFLPNGYTAVKQVSGRLTIALDRAPEPLVDAVQRMLEPYMPSASPEAATPGLRIVDAGAAGQGPVSKPPIIGIPVTEDLDQAAHDNALANLPPETLQEIKEHQAKVRQKADDEKNRK